VIQPLLTVERTVERAPGPPCQVPGRSRLARAIRKCRGDLFVFLTRHDVPATNNDCERALRPSVIFRKVTGGFRSEWGAHTYVAVASVIATGRLRG
jgi:transposase